MTALRIFDDRDRELLFVRAPRRIVSLVPSETFNVAALGAADRLVGRTRYCLAEGPGAEAIARAAVVGGTKDVDVEAVAALAPDLILANQEENTRTQVLQLAAKGLAVHIAFPCTVGAGLNHLARLARMLDVGSEEPVRELLRTGLRLLREAESAAAGRPPIPVFLPIWREPLMTVSAGTYCHDALALAGARNVFGDRQRRYPLAADLGGAPAGEAGERDVRYPRVQLSEVVERAPELVLLPDEPYPFGPGDVAIFAALDVPAARRGGVALCAGRDVCWPGAAALDALPRLRALVDGAARRGPGGR